MCAHLLVTSVDGLALKSNCDITFTNVDCCNLRWTTPSRNIFIKVVVPYVY